MPALTLRMARLAMHCYPFPRGSGRLIDQTFLRKLRFHEPTMTVKTSDGLSMRIFPNDHIGRHIYLTGAFDRTTVELMLKYSQPEDRIIDIGANIGYVSCVLLHRISGSRVVAVEPQPDCFGLLKENLLRVGGDRGCAICAAVSSQSGTGRLLINAANNGRSHLVEADSPMEMEGVIDVEMITADQFIQQANLDRVDLIKIDVEGHEQSVLESLEPAIRTFRPRAIIFEHYGDLAGTEHPLALLFDRLGYRVLGLHKKLTSFELVPVNACSGRVFNDYVAEAIE